MDQLKAELKRRTDEAAEQEEDDAASKPLSPCGKARREEGVVERVVVVGAGPAGLSAAIYAARAGLCPLVIAPPMGGQLAGKGVNVENYPGLVDDPTGKDMVTLMRRQAEKFNTEMHYDMVTSIDLSQRPFSVSTNTTTVQTHTVIISTGADSRWLGVPGEHEYRGFGVTSCATCDGFLFKNKPVVVVGGGDSAMEDALVLARICSKVTVVHRRDSFRASHILAQRVIAHPKINIMWNTTVESIAGSTTEADGTRVTGIRVKTNGESSELPVDAIFVAIGHIPNTDIFKGQLDMDANGYLNTVGKSTYTSQEGVFASGDVADHVYRQAITSGGTGAMAALDAERWLSEQGIPAFDLSKYETSNKKSEDGKESDTSTWNLNELGKWTMKQIRRYMSEKGIKCIGCLEKHEFLSRLRQEL